MTNESGSEREALVIARIVARREAVGDWPFLQRAAAIDREVWERLAHALHDDERIRRATADVVAMADTIGLPAPATPRRRLWPWLATSAAAALVVCAVQLGLGGSPAPRPAAPAPSATIEELPRLVLEARPAVDGRSTEVIYLRRIIERAAVGGVVELGVDEYGEPRPQMVDLVALQGPRRF